MGILHKSISGVHKSLIACVAKKTLLTALMAIFYNKSEVWISEERLYEVAYSFEVPDVNETMEDKSYVQIDSKPNEIQNYVSGV